MPRRSKREKVVAVIVAAGSGRRAGSRIAKQFLKLPGGTLLDHALERIEGHRRVSSVVIVVPRAKLRAVSALRRSHPKVAAVVAGGARRQDSVRNGVAAIDAGPGSIVLIHDAARPLVTERIIDGVIEAAMKFGAAVPGIEPADTVKEVGRDGSVRRTLTRARLRLIQTPQAFRLGWLRSALASSGGRRVWTDDASLVEAAGRKVKVVEGSPANFKVTTEADLARFEALAGGKA